MREGYNSASKTKVFDTQEINIKRHIKHLIISFNNRNKIKVSH